MSFMVFTAKRRLDDLSNAICESVFYDAMDAILDQELWRSFVHDVTGKKYAFDSLSDFLTSKDGLAIPNLGLFVRILKAVATYPSGVSESVDNFLKRFRDEGVE